MISIFAFISLKEKYYDVSIRITCSMCSSIFTMTNKCAVVWDHFDENHRLHYVAAFSTGKHLVRPRNAWLLAQLHDWQKSANMEPHKTWIKEINRLILICAKEMYICQQNIIWSRNIGLLSIHKPTRSFNKTGQFAINLDQLCVGADQRSFFWMDGLLIFTSQW